MAEAFVHGKVVQVVGKIEAAYGVDSSPVPATDAILVNDGSYVEPLFEETDRTALRGKAFAAGKVNERQAYDVVLILPLAGPPDPGVGAIDLELDDLLQAAGFKSTPAGAPTDTFVYTKNSLQLASLSLEMYLFGDNQATAELDQVLGCVFSPKLSCPGGGHSFWAFTGKGLYTTATNPAKPAANVFLHEFDECPSRGWTISIDGVDHALDGFEIDFGVAVEPRPSRGSSTGYVGWKHVHSSPIITLSPEFRFTSTYDRLAKALAGTGVVVSLLGDTLEGGRYKIDAPNAQWLSHKRDRSGGVVRAETTLVCRDSAGGTGDDSIQITVTRSP